MKTLPEENWARAVRKPKAIIRIHPPWMRISIEVPTSMITVSNGSTNREPSHYQMVTELAFSKTSPLPKVELSCNKILFCLICEIGFLYAIHLYVVLISLCRPEWPPIQRSFCLCWGQTCVLPQLRLHS